MVDGKRKTEDETVLKFRPSRLKRWHVVDAKKIDRVIEKYGIDETMDVLEAVGPVGALVFAVVTGGWNVWALPGYVWGCMKAIRAVRRAVKGIRNVPKEIKDLDDEEIRRLIAEGGEMVPLVLKILGRKESK